MKHSKNVERIQTQIHYDLGFEIVAKRGFETIEYMGKKGNDTLITNEDDYYYCILNDNQISYTELKKLFKS